MKKILVIEDEDCLRENIQELLEAEDYETIVAENGRIGIELARATVPDLIVCDVMMPELDGYGVLTSLRQDRVLGSIPFILLTAKAAKADWRQGMELGADDYLTKPFTRAELLGAITSRLRKQNLIAERYNTELQQAKEELNYSLYHDSLTKLPNRLSLLERFNQIQSVASPSDRLIPVMCLTIDRFSQITDYLTPEACDILLQAIAECLTSCVSQNDTVARLNESQFALILAEPQGKDEVVKIAQTIVSTLSQTFLLAGREVFVTASLGIALSPQDGTQIEQLLWSANMAMTQVKRQGGDRYQFYTPALKTQSADDLTLQTSLYHALARHQFQLNYQPQVDLRTGKIIGAEALLRWHHPEHGLVSPAKFIPIAEETGLIVSIGEWVLQKACEQTKHWHSNGFEGLRVAVNLSARQFNQPDLLDRIVAIVQKTDLDPHYIELELTESMLVQNTAASIERLKALKSFGIEIAIDDFGTGYASLSYLQQFPFDSLKIDRCFIREISKNPSNAAIVKAIIQIAKSLELRLTVEGVETEDELRFICQHHCETMQGYLFSRPLSAQDFEQLLISGKSLSLPNRA